MRAVRGEQIERAGQVETLQARHWRIGQKEGIERMRRTHRSDRESSESGGACAERLVGHQQVQRVFCVLSLGELGAVIVVACRLGTLLSLFAFVLGAS